ncbi:hypothetical protein DOTSEDRAFT_33366 [Dothistroma septosporum NZE10]|uniref:Uncharacterized protein n=1 Tax=Dothistroma septosporum (strain NZE10 / CBS 128990) TaxID=675120 RepID=N1PWN5_DOTSN|nr:hypothetical protein DOTSEDRAFT_33366 [Dothistroma septosporum NZE10]
MNSFKHEAIGTCTYITNRGRVGGKFKLRGRKHRRETELQREAPLRVGTIDATENSQGNRKNNGDEAANAGGDHLSSLRQAVAMWTIGAASADWRQETRKGGRDYRSTRPSRLLVPIRNFNTRNYSRYSRSIDKAVKKAASIAAKQAYIAASCQRQSEGSRPNRALSASSSDIEATSSILSLPGTITSPPCNTTTTTSDRIIQPLVSSQIPSQVSLRCTPPTKIGADALL